MFDLFRDPERLGRELGRFVRMISEALDPPTFTPEEFQAHQATVERLEGKVAELQEQGEQDQQALQELVRNHAATDEKLSRILDVLEKSTSPRDQQELPKWAALQARLRQSIKALLAFLGLALGEAWVQEQVYPLLKTLPTRTHDLWLDLIQRSTAEASAPLPPTSSPLPEPEPATTPPAEPPEPSSRPRRMSPNPRLPEMAPIPAGRFLMGSDNRRDPDAWDRELPQHRVYLAAYRIAKTPITVAQFKTFVRATRYKTAAEKEGWAWEWTGSKWEKVRGAYWAHPRGPRSDVNRKAGHPVTCVAWRDAVEFCKWANVRLPTEAEWEKAARGADGRIYPWGNDPPDERRCNFNLNVGDTTPVGQYPAGASPYGVLDMSGNVWEWTSTLFRDYPYDASDGREDPGADRRRVLRGGAFFSARRNVRSAYRHGSLIDYRYHGLGFRVVSPGLDPPASGNL